MTLPESTAVASAPSRHPLRRVLSKPLGAAAIAYLAILIIAVSAAPLLGPGGPLAQDLGDVFSGPSVTHLLGTDNLGRDILSRLLFGARNTLVSVLYALAVVLVIGVPVGLLAGYVGGWVDTVISWIADVIMSIPVIITLLVVLAVFGQDERLAMATFGLLGTPGMVRIVRGATFGIRHDLYITAARVSGLSAVRIIVRHVLPRIAGPIIVRAALFTGAAVVTETSLAFLGLSVQDPEPSWGGMVADASNVISQHPWQLFPPGLIIALTVLALGLLGDAVRDSRGQERVEATRRRSPRAAAVGGAPDAGALLSVRGLTVEIGGVPVVSDVDFDIRAGETVGLVGESGCGKSITGRSVLGLLPTGGQIVGGSVTFEGRDLVGLGGGEFRAIRGAQIAMISQEPQSSLDPNYTVGSQLAQLVRLHRRVTRAQARVEVIRLLEQVKLNDPTAVAKRYPHELSGGMAQRVCIAAALVGQPKLLIADEPTTALDVTVQSNILDLLRDIQAQTGMAVVLITHDWGVVADMCERAVVMYAGEVVETSEIRAIFRAPLHPYTEGLLASNPHSTPVGQPLPTIAGRVPTPGSWPAGCRFAARCRLRGPDCDVAPIPLLEPVPERDTRCLHYDLLEQASA